MVLVVVPYQSGAAVDAWSRTRRDCLGQLGEPLKQDDIEGHSKLSPKALL